MTTENHSQILLHTCCAGCTVGAVTALKDRWNISLYYDNSNIHPRSEWLARLKAVKQISEEKNLKLIVADWSPKKWYEAIEGNSNNANLRRCKKCWEMRLTGTAEKARELGVGGISTTLLSSMYQSRDEINRIGEDIACEHEMEWVSFSLDDDTEGITCLNGFYMQNYCGCAYSLTERMEEKWGRG